MKPRLTVLLVALLALAAFPSLSQGIPEGIPQIPYNNLAPPVPPYAGDPEMCPEPRPQTVYDAQTHERIAYKFSRCAGGYITGTNQITGRTWNADIKPNGVITGRDIDGHSWRYDPKTHLYTDQTTGRSCARTSIRQVCHA
jgi:hypothetical protein